MLLSTELTIKTREEEIVSEMHSKKMKGNGQKLQENVCNSQ